ncbi:MAG: glutamate-1-semialdehyde 2,1-aminomutase [Nitrospinaceae bacterium]|jgi:glutamate-1-semialdehyde 2,1-aminomutase|nr:glutamate-1-semialdehyde 2,1-aminomutase [Nitrospinaceae bacterium]|tara:strand:- start:4840 stop:6111 length:1272 start_codon:yes stop_codon:yes gene_type:complete
MSVNAKHYKERLSIAIPGGAHVHSKGYDQFPVNAPKITSRGQGAYLIDDQGNRYLDYGMALRTVTIGYGEDAVNRGAIEQINNGNTSTFPTLIELQAAERLIELIDSFDMVKFAKDGSTVTTAAVKLSRAYTGKEMVARCSDHPFFSYNDWFIGTTPHHRGCLKDDYEKTKLFRYNNISSLESLLAEYPEQFACVILEPALSIMEPENDFLHQVRDLCRDNNMVFILDEMCTGFRWHLKGAQYYYGVKPDLCAFGKGMANGFSVSALGGRKEIMELGSIDTEDRVFFLSATHGAEMSGLGAFMATLDFMQEHNVIEHIWIYGEKLINRMNETAKDMDLSDNFKVYGLPCLPYFATFDKDGNRDLKLGALFQQEMARHAVIMRNIVICYRHGEEELQMTHEALVKALEIYKKALAEGVGKYLMK